MSTVRVSVWVPGLTAGGRRGLLGADEPLDAQGARQVARLHLPEHLTRGARLLTAPEAQCRQTASVVAARLTPSPDASASTPPLGPLDPDVSAPRWAGTVGEAEVDEALRDWDLGAWCGRAVEEVAGSDPAAYGEWVVDPAAAPHGGESLLALVERAGAWLATLDGTVGAVACVPVARAIVVAALGLPPSAFWSLDLEPAARVDLTVRAGRAALRWVGPAS